MASDGIPDRKDDHPPPTKIGTDVQSGLAVFISRQDRQQHFYAIGATGTGKSTLVRKVIGTDIAHGDGVLLIEPRYSLTKAVIADMPEHRLDDVILVDLEDFRNSVGISLFECPDPTNDSEVAKVADFIMHLFEQVWALSIRNAPQMTYVLRHVIMTLLQNPGTSFHEIPFLLTHDVIREHLLRNVKNAHTQRFWQDFNRKSQREKTEFISSTINKVDAYLVQPIIARIVSQSKSTLDFRTLMDQGKIVLVRLSPQLEEHSKLIGALLIAKCLMAAYARDNIPEDERSYFHLFCDEFQRFATSDFATFIAESRQSRVSMYVSNQSLLQLDEANRSAVLDSGTLLAFRVSGDNGKALAKNYDTSPPKVLIGMEPVRSLVTDVIDHIVQHGHPDARVARFAQFELLNFVAFLREHAPVAKHRRALGGSIGIHPVDLHRGKLQLNETFARCMREGRADLPISPLAIYFLAAAQKDYCEWSMEWVVKTKGFLEEYSFGGFYQGAEAFGTPAFVQPDAVARFLASHKRKDRVYAQALVNLITELRYCMAVLSREPLLEATGQWEPKYHSDTHAEMENKIANELSTQPNYQARVKLVSQTEHVIRTDPLPRFSDEMVNARIAYIKRQMLRQGLCKDAQAVENEIAERLEKLRQGIPLVEHPPADSGRQDQAALPPERPEREPDKPPPTHMSGKKTPEETPSLPTSAQQHESVTSDLIDEDFLKETIHSGWTKLTETDVMRIGGRKDELIRVLQERYGYTRAAAQQEIDRRFREYKKDMAVRESPPKTKPDELLPTPALQFESLTFYESGKDIPPHGERRYSSSFPQRTTRYVVAAIHLRNLWYGKRDQTFQLAARYYNPDGTSTLTRNQEKAFQKDWKTVLCFVGLGWDNPGNWKPGTYRAEILIDGVMFAEGSFTIEESPPAGEPPPPTSISAKTTPDDGQSSSGNKQERYAALREELIPLVRRYMLQAEAKIGVAGSLDSYYPAIHCALTLQDRETAKRLLPIAMRPDSILMYDDIRSVGKICILLGDEATAKKIIQHVEANFTINRSKIFYELIAEIAADLSDKTLARRLMLGIEKHGSIYAAAKIAVKIGERETIARMMQQTEQLPSYYSAITYALPLFAPYHAGMAKKLMERMQLEDNVQHLDLPHHRLAKVGEAAAFLGDLTTAKNMMNKLKEQRFYHLVSEIAAIIGDIKTAEDMLWEAKKKSQYYWTYCDYSTASRHNPEAAFHMLKVLETQVQGYEIGSRALRILENLNSLPS
jgi:hypothetical protein